MLNESTWFALWMGVALKSTVLLSAGWLLSLVLRRGSAAVRHLIWTGAAVAVLALPFFSVWMPALRIPSVAAIAPAAAAFFETTATTQGDAAAPGVPTRSGGPATERPTRRLDWRLLLMSLWAAGAAAAFAQILIAFAAMSRVRRTAKRSVHGPLAAQLARESGISYAVEVFETQQGCMPMTCGILRPAICMPRDAELWTEERRRMVLLHELAHVRRGDVATHLVARLALILNWWNPLAWSAWREFLKERERATDDLVLHSGARASEYAGHLLEVARRMQLPPALAWGAVAMARQSQLEGRLVAILDSNVNRKTPSRASALVAAFFAIVLAAPFAAVHALGQQASTAVLADIDATIRAAAAQKDYEMLEKPAEAFQAQRQYDNAKKLLDAAIAIRAEVKGTQSPEYGAGLMKLADLEKQRNRPKDAAEFYAKAVQVLGDRPAAARALIYLGVMTMSNKNYQQAIDYFQKAQNLDAAEAGPAGMWMALVREREQNPAEAETLYREALAVQDANSDGMATTMELYARLLKDQKRDEEAKSMSDRAFEIRRVLGEQKHQTKSTALRIGGDVIAPRVLSKIDPEYNEEARSAKYQGTVVLALEIDTNGLTRNIRIAKGLGLGLDENAVTAVRQWRFQPATKNAAAVTVQATIEVNFRLL